MAQAERRLVVARRELARVMGRTDRPVGAVSGRLDLPEPGGDRDLEALADQAPMHTVARAELDAARAGVTVARSRYFPSLSASAGIGRSGGDWPPGNERWSTGLNLSLPVFSGGRDLSGARAAEADARRAEAALRVVWGRVLVGLEDADATLKNAVGRGSVQREFLEAAEVRSEIARSQYTNGLLSFEDWDFIESELINAQNAWLVSLRDAVIAEAQWDRTIGRELSP